MTGSAGIVTGAGPLARSRWCGRFGSAPRKAVVNAEADHLTILGGN